MRVIVDVSGYYDWEIVDDPEAFYSWVPVPVEEDSMTEEQVAELEAWRADGPPKGYRFTDEGVLERWTTDDEFLTDAAGKTLRRVLVERDTYTDIALQPSQFQLLMDSEQEHMVTTQKEAVLWIVRKAMQREAPRDKWVGVTVEGHPEVEAYLRAALEIPEAKKK